MPLLTIGIATVTFRVVQIPLVEPGFSPAQFMAAVTPKARKTADMYLRAAETIDDAAWKEHWGTTNPMEPAGEEDRKIWRALRDKTELAWLSANQEPLKLALEATQRPDCVFRMAIRRNASDDLDRVLPVASLVRADAHRLEHDGDLDGMLERELALLRMSVHMRQHQFLIASGEGQENSALDTLVSSWGTRPEQTPELIRRALAALEAWQRSVPPPTDEIEAHYVWFEKFLSLDADALATVGEYDKNFAANLHRYVLLANLMPWEVARATRLEFLHRGRHEPGGMSKRGSPTDRQLRYNSARFGRKSVSATIPCGQRPGSSPLRKTTTDCRSTPGSAARRTAGPRGCCWRSRGGASNMGSCPSRSMNWSGRISTGCRSIPTRARASAIFPTAGPMRSSRQFSFPAEPLRLTLPSSGAAGKVSCPPPLRRVNRGI